MAKKNHVRFNESFLRSKGFTQNADGSWGKESSPPANPAGRADSEPPKSKPRRKKRVSTPAKPIRRFVAIVTVRTVRSRDYDGLGAASKHYFDALQHCGVLEDDSREHLEVLAVSEPVQHFSEEETVIEIYQLP